MVCCAAYRCSHDSSSRANDANKVQFFCFPKDPERREKWLKAIRRADFKPSQYSRLCSEHFERKYINFTYATPRLRDEAIPTIFKSYPSSLQPSVAPRKRPVASSKHLEAIDLRDLRPAESCVFHNCKNRNVVVGEKSEVEFFPFPADPDLRDNWLRVALRTPGAYGDLVAKGVTPRVCSDHFFPTDFELKSTGRELKSDAVPVIFQVNYHDGESAPKRKRRRKMLDPFYEYGLKHFSVSIPENERRLADERLDSTLTDVVEIKEEPQSFCDVTLDDHALGEFDHGEPPPVGSPKRPSQNVGAPRGLIPVLEPDNPVAPFPASLKRLKSKKLIIKEMKPSSNATAASDLAMLPDQESSLACSPNSCPSTAGVSKTVPLPPLAPLSRTVAVLPVQQGSGASTALRSTLLRPKQNTGTKRKDYTNEDEFRERLARVPLSQLMIFHPTVRSKVSAFQQQVKLLHQQVRRLEERLAKTTRKLTTALRSSKSGVNQPTRKVDNLLVIETVPECQCRKTAPSPPREPPRENLEDVLCDAAGKYVPSAVESQEVVEENERLIKKISGIHNSMKGRVINRVVVIQAEDLLEFA